LKIPGNISYLITKKRNNSLPEYFNNYLLNNNKVPKSFFDADNYRKNLIKSNEQIKIQDFGAGSNKFKSDYRNISDIASVSGTNYAYGLFFHKIVEQFHPSQLLELGTSLGIGTMYFATASKNLNITTIEACNQTYLFTKNNFDSFGIKNNINLINNDFDTVLNSESINDKRFDLIFIDGNHKGEKLLDYYNKIVRQYTMPKNIIIVDDINWSTDMFKAWKQITESDNTKTYLNLFRAGIIFKGYDLPAGNFTINFVNNSKL
jgi:predicted O-methyltransferase YrrM